MKKMKIIKLMKINLKIILKHLMIMIILLLQTLHQLKIEIKKIYF